MTDSGRWRAVTALIAGSSRRHFAGSKVAATRSRQGVDRSQARSTTYARAFSSAARCAAKAGSGHCSESTRTTWASRRSESTASGVPVRRPDDGGQVAHDERVHDRVHLGEVCLAYLDQHLLVVERELAGSPVTLHPRGDPRVELRPPGLHRAEDEPRGVVAAHALQPVQDLAAPLVVGDHHEIEHPRGCDRLVLVVVLLEELLQGGRYVGRARCPARTRRRP